MERLVDVVVFVRPHLNTIQGQVDAIGSIVELNGVA